MSDSGQKGRLKLLHKGLILVLVPLAIELIFVAILWQLLLNADTQTRRLSHAKQVISNLNQLDQSMLDVGRSAALFTVTHDRKLLERTTVGLRSVGRCVKEVERITNESPEERAAFEKIKPAVADIETLVTPIVLQVERAEPFSMMAERENIKKLVNYVTRLKASSQDLLNLEYQVENEGVVQEANARRMVYVTGIGGGVIANILIALVLALFFYRQLLQRLRVLIENTDRLARNEPLLPRISGGDEIEQLDHVFHNMADALAASAEYKKELIAMVSHDLRSPLTSVQTSLALLEIGALGDIPEKAKQEVQVAERNTGRMINMINDLLDVERIEAGKLEIRYQTVSSGALIEKTIEAVNPLAQQYSIQLQSDESDIRFSGDQDRLSQVLINLLTNAIKFSPPSSVVKVDVRDAGTELEFRVSDQGPGIPEDLRATIFERFHRVETGESERLKGSGLGLAICKAIVLGHKGEIGVESGGGGSTFWFRVPKGVVA